MSGYSYTEIQNMQQKAMERVREMKRNSDIVTQSAQRELDFTQKTINEEAFCKETKPKVTNMPPNFPENKSYTYFKGFNKTDEKANQPIVETQKKQGVENLFSEPDRALILGLVMLLKSEGADESLIMALSYILS